MFSEIDLSDPIFAEAIFLFCNDGKQLNDNDRKILIHENISFAEFVQKYKYKSFCVWYNCNFCVTDILQTQGEALQTEPSALPF